MRWHFRISVLAAAVEGSVKILDLVHSFDIEEIVDAVEIQ